MPPSRDHALSRPSAFGWLGAGTLALLLIPLVAMRFTHEVNWAVGDFAVMGALLLGFGSAFILLARRLPPQRRWIAAAACAVVFVAVWAELAVGVFTRLGA